MSPTQNPTRRWSPVGNVFVTIVGVLTLIALFAAVALPTLLLPRKNTGAPLTLDFQPRVVQTNTTPPRWQLPLETSGGDRYVFTVAGAGRERFQRICDLGFRDADHALTWVLAVDEDADGFISTLEAVNSGDVRADIIAASPPSVSGAAAPEGPARTPPVQSRAERAQPTRPATGPQPAQPARPTIRDKIDPEIVNFWMLRQAGGAWVLEVHTTQGPAAFRYRNRDDAATDIEWLQEHLDAEE